MLWLIATLMVLMVTFIKGIEFVDRSKRKLWIGIEICRIALYKTFKTR